jgi:hypothetical protein
MTDSNASTPASRTFSYAGPGTDCTLLVVPIGPKGQRIPAAAVPENLRALPILGFNRSVDAFPPDSYQQHVAEYQAPPIVEGMVEAFGEAWMASDHILCGIEFPTGEVEFITWYTEELLPNRSAFIARAQKIVLNDDCCGSWQAKAYGKVFPEVGVAA